jgi:hypothetical protein
MLKGQSPELRLIVSFADPYHGHNGSIYQAMNWFYLGVTPKAKQWFHNGEWKHNREITSGAFGGVHKYKGYQNLPNRELPGKYRYLYPLDRAMRRQIAPLAQPYPKKDTRPVNGDTLATREAGRFDSEPGALNCDNSVIDHA